MPTKGMIDPMGGGGTPSRTPSSKGKMKAVIKQDLSPCGTSSSMDMASVDASDESAPVTKRLSKKQRPPKLRVHATYRLRVSGEMADDEYMETRITKKKWLERPLGKSVVVPFLAAHASRMGAPVGKAPYTLGCVERVEIYGLECELTWPTRQWAHGDTPITIVIFLGEHEARQRKSLLGWLRSVMPTRRPSQASAALHRAPVIVTSGVAIDVQHAIDEAPTPQHRPSATSASPGAFDDETKEDEAPDDGRMTFTSYAPGRAATATVVDFGDMNMISI